MARNPAAIDPGTDGVGHYAGMEADHGVAQ